MPPPTDVNEPLVVNINIAGAKKNSDFLLGETFGDGRWGAVEGCDREGDTETLTLNPNRWAAVRCN